MVHSSVRSRTSQCTNSPIFCDFRKQWWGKEQDGGGQSGGFERFSDAVQPGSRLGEDHQGQRLAASRVGEGDGLPGGGGGGWPPGVGVLYVMFEDEVGIIYTPSPDRLPVPVPCKQILVENFIILYLPNCSYFGFQHTTRFLMP